MTKEKTHNPQKPQQPEHAANASVVYADLLSEVQKRENYERIKAARRASKIQIAFSMKDAWKEILRRSMQSDFGRSLLK